MKPDLMKFLVDNVYIIVVAFVSGGMLLWPVLRRGAGGASVNTLDATQLINRQDALVLDVRNADEFQRGHILNARNIPLSQIDARIGDIARYKEKPVIVTCETGNRSSAAAASLRKQGFAQVFNLSGGIAAWQQAGLPVEK
jgi:rhodanese-related sulfurtransferase